MTDTDYRKGAGAAAMSFAQTLETTRSRTTPEKLAGESFARGTTYTKPRTLTLDTKYEGVPCINVWTGYAVMVVSKSGDRKIFEGPCTILLDYDQTLEVLNLSTGKPKNTDKLEPTVYLRVKNNKVSDIIDVETSDHVPAQVKISMRVNFEGDDPSKWFDVENQVDIESFYRNHVDFIRDAILGPSKDGKRDGMKFEENGMVVHDHGPRCNLVRCWQNHRSGLREKSLVVNMRIGDDPLVCDKRGASFPRRRIVVTVGEFSEQVVCAIRTQIIRESIHVKAQLIRGLLKGLQEIRPDARQRSFALQLFGFGSLFPFLLICLFSPFVGGSRLGVIPPSLLDLASFAFLPDRPQDKQ